MVDPNVKIKKKSLKFKWKIYVNVKCRENLMSQMYSMNIISLITGQNTGKKAQINVA